MTLSDAQQVQLERLADWWALTNGWEIPAEFRAYRHTINNRASKEDAFCLGLNSALDALLPRDMKDAAIKRRREAA